MHEVVMTVDGIVVLCHVGEINNLTLQFLLGLFWFMIYDHQRGPGKDLRGS